MSTQYEQYDAAIFFDNLESHVSKIGRLCGGKVYSVNVGGNSEDPPLVPFTNWQFREFYESLGKGNTYLRFIRESSPDGDAFDSLSGIKREDVRKFESWAKDTENIRRRAIFLDWDRTITIFEGIAVGYLRDKQRSFKDVFPRVNIEDTLLYLCGGSLRLSMLRSMLKDAYNDRIDIYLLTNNSACSYRFFKEIIDGLIGKDKIRIICSGDEPYYGNKAKAIRKYLTNCSMSSQHRRTYKNRTSPRFATPRRTYNGGHSKKKKFR